MLFSLAPPLAEAKVAAQARVDAAAEKARLRYMTPGAGQALEYQQTEAEARAYKAAGYPDFVPSDYPFIEAERQAQLAATGVLPDAQAVADEVIAQADAWIKAGSQIKALRRAAKLKIETATTHAEIRAAEQIDWPAP